MNKHRAAPMMGSAIMWPESISAGRAKKLTGVMHAGANLVSCSRFVIIAPHRWYF
jgi:hypothetical protein